MIRNDNLQLILKSKIYTIPSNFSSLINIDPKIYNILMTKKQYVIQSSVDEDVFHSFIDHWLNNTIPDINFHNYYQFYLLSQEFDKMKDILQIFCKNSKISRIDTLNSQYKEAITNFKTKTQKYQEIISNLFKKSRIDSYSKFLEIKKDLFLNCCEEDEKQVYFLTCKKIEHDGISYIINEDDKTASVYQCISEKDEILIPKSIKYKGNAYLITKILEDSFQSTYNLKTITFSEDSELQTIEKNSFRYSHLEKISFPANLINLEEGWCNATRFLNDVSVNPKNKYLVLINNQLLMSKTNKKSVFYDVIEFSNRNISKVKIPFFIKKISSFSFQDCKNLHIIEFEKESKLKSIGKYAFSQSSLNSITIPSQVQIIDKNSFFNCIELFKVRFEKDSKLRIIESFAFSSCSLEYIKIPRLVYKISKNAFYQCSLLKKVEFCDQSELILIDDEAFCETSIYSISIPPRVTRIGQYCFHNCYELISVNLSEKSEMIFIDTCAFCNSSIQSITMPSNARLNKQWCKELTNLNEIKIIQNKQQFILCYDDSLIIGKSDYNSKNYDIIHFACRNVTNVKIPSFIKIIDANAFDNCRNLVNVEISKDSELEIIEKLAFAFCPIEKFFIPSHLKIIGSSVFHFCLKLKEIEFTEDSELEKIGESAFVFSSLESISFPSSLIELEEGWCNGTEKLKKVSVSPKNKYLKLLDDSFLLSKTDKKSDIYDVFEFANRNVSEVKVPFYITKISSFSFQDCKDLHTIEFEKNSQLQIIGKAAFSSNRFQRFLIPRKVTHIDCFSFQYCIELETVEFEEESELIEIGRYSFSNTALKSFCIPKSVVKVDETAFYRCDKLQVFEFSENSKITFIMEDTWRDTSAVFIMFPQKLKHIFCK